MMKYSLLAMLTCCLLLFTACENKSASQTAKPPADVQKEAAAAPAGNAHSAPPAEAEKKPSDETQGDDLKKALIHHNFVLASVNGKPYAHERMTPSIAFNEGLHVSGAVCNRYSGQGELNGNILTVKQMVSTKMFCPEQELNDLERAFALLLINGAAVRLEGQKLFLSSEEYKLEFNLKDLVQ